MEKKPPDEHELINARDRWFSEPLKTPFPPLGTEADQHAPTTCNELIFSSRLAAAFSALADAFEAVGMTYDEALAQDRQANLERFGVEDPVATLQGLSRQIELAPSGRVDAEVLRAGFRLLEVVRHASLELAAHYGRSVPGAPQDVASDTQQSKLLEASYSADAKAIEQAQGIVRELLTELGIALTDDVGQKGD